MRLGWRCLIQAGVNRFVCRQISQVGREVPSDIRDSALVDKREACRVVSVRPAAVPSEVERLSILSFLGIRIPIVNKDPNHNRGELPVDRRRWTNESDWPRAEVEEPVVRELPLLWRLVEARVPGIRQCVKINHRAVRVHIPEFNPAPNPRGTVRDPRDPCKLKTPMARVRQEGLAW